MQMVTKTYCSYMYSELIFHTTDKMFSRMRTKVLSNYDTPVSYEW